MFYPFGRLEEAFFLRGLILSFVICLSNCQTCCYDAAMKLVHNFQSLRNLGRYPTIESLKLILATVCPSANRPL
jgi:hypothetical protein